MLHRHGRAVKKRAQGCGGGPGGLHGAGILHGSDDPQPVATARAGQAIEIERSRTRVVAQKPTH